MKSLIQAADASCLHSIVVYPVVSPLRGACRQIGETVCQKEFSVCTDLLR
jgi:hypothetical protein